MKKKMKIYKVTIQRAYDTYFEIEADTEEEAIDKANDLFNDLEISGFEMYACDIEIEEEQDE